LEHYLAQKGEEGATLDEIADVALRDRWVSRGWANRVYAARMNGQRKINIGMMNEKGYVHHTEADMTPASVELQGLHPNAVRHVLGQVLLSATRPSSSSDWVRKEGRGKTARYFSTGTGLKRKPQGGWTEEEITQTPEQIGADVAMREVIRALKPYKDQKTHRVTQAEWNAIRHWLNLVAVTWDNQK